MNKAWIGAWKKGIEARKAGFPIEACPYADKRKWNGKLTWSRAFIRAWEDGWSGRTVTGGVVPDENKTEVAENQ